MTDKYLKRPGPIGKPAGPKKPPPTKEEPDKVLVPAAILCKACEEELVQSPWNSKVDILYCDNYRCSMCRVPVGHIRIKETDMSTVIERLQAFNRTREKFRDQEREVDQYTRELMIADGITE